MDYSRTIILRELPRLRRFCYSLTSSKSDADDLVQSAVLRLMKRGIPAEVDPVPWMLKVCKNLWIDEIRSREVRMRAANDESLQEEATEDRSLRLVETERVLQAMANLPDNHRLPLSLVALEGMSYQEAADILDLPIGTIMSRVARARGKLAQMFKLQEE